MSPTTPIDQANTQKRKERKRETHTLAIKATKSPQHRIGLPLSIDASERVALNEP